MDNKKFSELTQSMQTKIGEDATGLIADDLGILITDNAQMNSEIEAKDKEIATLKKEKENLIATNGNLLQQVVMSNQNNFSNKTDEEEKEKKYFDYKSLFDEKGNFKK